MLNLQEKVIPLGLTASHTLPGVIASPVQCSASPVKEIKNLLAPFCCNAVGLQKVQLSLKYLFIAQKLGKKKICPFSDILVLQGKY